MKNYLYQNKALHQIGASPDPNFTTASKTDWEVIVVGAGPVGLTAALDLAQKGHHVLLLDEDEGLSTGSRAICFAQRSLEVFQRLGVAAPMRAKGVQWNVGKIFYQNDLVYQFDLQPEEGAEFPAFINIQQYYVEGFLMEKVMQEPNIEFLKRTQVIDIVGVYPCGRPDGGRPDGGRPDDIKVIVKNNEPINQSPNQPINQYSAQFVIAADGARSPIRKMMGLDYDGVQFEEKFLIADVKMKAEFPSERWFWFEPPFSNGQSALLHKQPDDIWRIDLQLGHHADLVAEAKPENIIPRLRKMLGETVEFELDWVSVYSFHSRKMDNMVHGRVLFAGDSAHIVSPFGARGANSGIQDADNLAWKLSLILQRKADISFLQTYNIERSFAAAENLRATESTAEFMSPDGAAGLALRNAVLHLATEQPFARTLLNSGRLSKATVYPNENTENSLGDFDTKMVVGASCADLPVFDMKKNKTDFLLNYVGNTFCLLVFYDEKQAKNDFFQKISAFANHFSIKIIVISKTKHNNILNIQNIDYLLDTDSLIFNKYDAQHETCYLIRPDQHISARFRKLDFDNLEKCLKIATEFNTVASSDTNLAQAQTASHTKKALITTPNMSNPDAFFTALSHAYIGKTEAECAALNARLLLLLANQVGDEAVLREAVFQSAVGSLQ
jgi:3-(3-hydroxy-phenyl)propionate hydroxylase